MKLLTVMLSFLVLSRTVRCAMYDGIFESVQQYELPDLPYSFNELEPYIDERTVKVHYLGHHKAYTDKMNAALKDWREKDPTNQLAFSSIEDILENIEQVPSEWQTSLIHNGGGYLNHIFYWTTMCPSSKKEPIPPSLEGFINDNFKGGLTELQRSFTGLAKSLFGSGYVWIVLDKNGGLSVIATNNQDSPQSQGLFPILVLDVWEHAYYLKHQNKRPGYVEDWWGVVCWKEVENLKRVWQLKNKVKMSHGEL